MPTCARCGERFDRSFRYCPNCGERMGAGVKSRYEDAPRGRSGGSVLVSLVALCLGVGGAAWIGHNIQNAPTCAQATQALDRLHPVVFSLMDTAGAQVGVTCEDGLTSLNPFTGERQVRAAWNYQGTLCVAVYEDSPLGKLEPANATAVELDKASSGGASAVRMLLGGP